MKIPWSQLEPAVETSLFGMENPGFCLACGEEHELSEPDLRYVQCYACGAAKVASAEYILAMDAIDYDK